MTMSKLPVSENRFDRVKGISLAHINAMLDVLPYDLDRRFVTKTISESMDFERVTGYKRMLDAAVEYANAVSDNIEYCELRILDKKGPLGGAVYMRKYNILKLFDNNGRKIKEIDLNVKRQ